MRAAPLPPRPGHVWPPGRFSRAAGADPRRFGPTCPGRGPTSLRRRRRFPRPWPCPDARLACLAGLSAARPPVCERRDCQDISNCRRGTCRCTDPSSYARPCACPLPAGAGSRRVSKRQTPPPWPPRLASPPSSPPALRARPRLALPPTPPLLACDPAHTPTAGPHTDNRPTHRQPARAPAGRWSAHPPSAPPVSPRAAGACPAAPSPVPHLARPAPPPRLFRPRENTGRGPCRPRSRDGGAVA